MSSIPQEDLAQALSALQDIAKGHNSRGTNTTRVETMADGSKGAGSGTGATQVYHTDSNSARDGWAGSEWDGVDADDSIDENGTDYQAQAKVMKSIMRKLAKGQRLSAAEYLIMKGMMNFDEEDDAKKAVSQNMSKDEDPDMEKAMDEDEEDEEDEEVSKSLSDFAYEDPSVSQGLEVSEFLSGFATAVEKSLASLEQRIVARLSGQTAASAEATGEFQKSLASAVAGLGEAIAAISQRVEQVESTPARGPKTTRVAPLVKGGYGGEGNLEPLNKALVSNTLVSLVTEGKASVQDVVKFESTGFLPAELDAQVRTVIGR